MLEDLIQSPVHPSLDECLSSSLTDQILNFDEEENLFREANYSPRSLSPTNNVVCSSDVPATVTFQATDTTTTDLSCYDNSFDSDLISVLLNPQPPPEPEPDILPSQLPAVSMAPIHPMNKLNPMICNPPFTSYQPNSVVMSQLPLERFGLPEYMGMEPSAMQLCSFMDANGGIGEQLYAEGMGMPTCVADDEVGIYANVGMPMTPMEAAEACGIGGINTYEAMSAVYSPRNLHKVLGDSTSTASVQGTFDFTAMDDSNHKVGRASPEERKKKLDRYKSKKKERNFRKTIKYACRKTLADSRPRVRGRFAKNDEFSEVVQTPSSANGGYDDEATSLRNDEDMLLDPSDILAHISGVNSFGFNFHVESWM